MRYLWALHSVIWIRVSQQLVPSPSEYSNLFMGWSGEGHIRGRIVCCCKEGLGGVIGGVFYIPVARPPYYSWTAQHTKIVGRENKFKVWEREFTILYNSTKGTLCSVAISPEAVSTTKSKPINRRPSSMLFLSTNFVCSMVGCWIREGDGWEVIRWAVL